MAIQAIIFDMDGLMFDTEPLYRRAWQRAAADFGYALSDDLHSRLMGRNTADSERSVCGELGPDFPMEAFRIKCQQYEAEFQTKPAPKKPGLDDLLDLLDSRGIRKAVATSTRRSISVPQLAMSGLLGRFDAVATGDEVNRGKPAPDVFLLAAERLGISPKQCLALEDAEPGVLAARSAGMRVYLVPDLQAPSATALEAADGVFHSLPEVARHLDPMLLGSPDRPIARRQ